MWNCFYTKTEDEHIIRYAVGVKGESLDLDKINRFILFLNGRNQWIEINDKILDDVNISEDSAILTWDHRGQGDSEGKRASIDSYDTFVKDTKFLIDTVVGSRPYSIMSHSMGGLITLYGCVKKEFNPESIVLVSPLIRLPKYRLLHFMTGCLYPIKGLGVDEIWRKLGTFPSTSYETNNLTHSYKYFNKVKNTPYPIPLPDLDWLHASIKASKYITNPKNMVMLLDIPICLIVAQKEQVVDSKSFSQWFYTLQKLKSQSRNKNTYSDKGLMKDQEIGTRRSKIIDQFFSISGAYHELLTEEDHYRDQVIKIINNWLDITEFNQVSSDQLNELDKIG